MTIKDVGGFLETNTNSIVFVLAMHSLAAASRPRLSETGRSGLCSRLPAMRSVGEFAASQKQT